MARLVCDDFLFSHSEEVVNVMQLSCLQEHGVAASAAPHGQDHTLRVLCVFDGYIRNNIE
jgi:hypothetical protein